MARGPELEPLPPPSDYTSFIATHARGTTCRRPKKLAIAIDYGTTNSGVAYAVVTDPKTPDCDITVIREWAHGVREENLPSDIAYDGSGEPVGYAFDIPDDVQPLQWVKLLLEPSGLRGNKAVSDRLWRLFHQLGELGKYPVDVIADYLRWLWEQIEKSLEESGDDVDAEEVVVVITLPASWSDKAKDTMLKAAQKAGIDSNGRTLKFRVEPEAAALFELKARARRGQIDVDDCFIVCDAGGGTVDLVSFQVLSVEPLSLNQEVVSKGGFCGSAFINAQFETQLRVFLGSDYNKLSSEAMAQIRHKFEHTIKRRYNPERPAEYTIPVPGLEDNELKGIKDGKLRLKEGMLRRCFEEIMTDVNMLIDEQKDMLKAKGLLPYLKAILLVGGFGGSEYLQARIRQGYPENERIKVWRGSHPWTAVVQGAVQCEVANREIYAPVNQRLSNYHYGIRSQRGDRKGVQWLVRKGQDVRDSSHIARYNLRLEDRPGLDDYEYVTISIQLVKTDRDVVTEDLDSSLEPHVDIDCKVSPALRKSPEARLISRDPKVWQIPAQLMLEMDGPLLTARCKIQGRDVGLLDLKYRDDFNFPSHVPSPMPSPLFSYSQSPLQHQVIPEDPEDTEQQSDVTLVERQMRSSSSMSQWTQPRSPKPNSLRDSKGTDKGRDSVISQFGSASPPQLLSRFSWTPSEEGSPSSRRTTFGFFRRESKSDYEKEMDRLKKEQKAKENEERRKEKEEKRKKEDAERLKNQGNELWVPYTKKNGELMLRNRLTGEMIEGASQQASGYGLRGF